jgi:hypothetical protein
MVSRVPAEQYELFFGRARQGSDVIARVPWSF